MNEGMDGWMNESINQSRVTISNGLHWEQCPSLCILFMFWQVFFVRKNFRFERSVLRQRRDGLFFPKRTWFDHFGNLPQDNFKNPPKKRFDLYSLGVLGHQHFFLKKCIKLAVSLKGTPGEIEKPWLGGIPLVVQVDPEEALEELRESLKAKSARRFVGWFGWIRTGEFGLVEKKPPGICFWVEF